MRLSIIAVLVVMAAPALGATVYPAASAPQAPAAEKNATVTLGASDWQAVVATMQDSTRVSAHEAGRIVQSIVGQAGPQLAPPPPPKKEAGKK